MGKILEIDQLSFSYNRDTVIFKDLDLCLYSDEIVCILGESGSGKSTLLKLLNNDFSDDIKGKKIINQGILLVPQDYNSMLLQWMTVEENILFGLKQKDISEVLKILEIEKYKNEYPKKLSGGQKQRVILARALLRKPKLLLLDEPFSSVDIYSRQKIIKKLLVYLLKHNISALWITHSIEEAVEVTNKIYIIKNMTLKRVIGNTKKELITTIINEFLQEKTKL